MTEEQVAEDAKTLKELQQKLERNENAMKDSVANPSVVEPCTNEDLLAQVESLEAQLSAAEKKETDAFRNGYQDALDDCSVQAQTLIDNAIRQESWISHHPIESQDPNKSRECVLRSLISLRSRPTRCRILRGPTAILAVGSSKPPDDMSQRPGSRRTSQDKDDIYMTFPHFRSSTISTT